MLVKLTEIHLKHLFSSATPNVYFLFFGKEVKQTCRGQQAEQADWVWIPGFSILATKQ